MRYVTQREAARMCGVNESTIWRWRKAGLLATYTIAGHILLKEREVLALRRPRTGRPRGPAK